MVTIDLKCPFELTAWDRQTDRQTDGSQHYLMSTVGGHSNYRNRELRRVVVKPAGLQHDSNFEFGDLIITRLRWGIFHIWQAWLYLWCTLTDKFRFCRELVCLRLPVPLMGRRHYVFWLSVSACVRARVLARHFVTQRLSDPGIKRPGDPVDPVTLFYNELQMSTYV